MTDNRSTKNKTRHKEEDGVMGDTESTASTEVSDDLSSGPCPPPPSEISSSVSDNMPKKAEKTVDVLKLQREVDRNDKSLENADHIRKNTTHEEASTKQYQSYHDSYSPAHASSHYNHSGTNTSFNFIPHNYLGGEDDLSVSKVVSMAFDCVAHCVTEGYRAASNYYSSYQQEGYPSWSDGQTYRNLSTHENERNSDRNASLGNGISKCHGNGGYHTSLMGYQNQHMERGFQHPPRETELLSGISGEPTIIANPLDLQARGEYASVPVPSTYQGGNIYILK